MENRYRLTLLAIVLFAFGLRLLGLFANSFHSDEALFATWARSIAVWRDPLLIGQAVDKPPLLFYLQALFYPLQGPVEWAARLPNFIVSLLLIPLTAVLTRTAYRQSLAALVAALIVAFSPLAIQFSATAFTDPLLTFFLMATLTMMIRPGRHCERSRRVGCVMVAGVLFGCAAATKYQAWLFLPLLVGSGWLGGYRRRDWLLWLSGLVPIVTAVLLWEAARTGRLSLWSTQVSNFGGLRLAWPWEVVPRAAGWWQLWQQAFPGWLLLLLALGLVWLLWRGRRARDIAARFDRLLIAFVTGYSLLHWLLAIPVWDRYLLPLLPLLAVLSGRLLAAVATDYGTSRLPGLAAERARARVGLVLFVLLGATLLWLAWPARDGRWPLGGQPGADQGAATVAAHLAEAPYGTVLYDHWFSWQWRYHLFDGKVYVSWFPHSEALIADLNAFARGDAARYLALPADGSGAALERRLWASGFSLQLIAKEGTINLYQVFRVGSERGG